MKRKLVILSLMMAAFGVAATAQSKGNYNSEKPTDNIFVNASVGVQKCIEPNASENNATFVVNASVGKWINPVWGFRFGATVGKASLNSNFYMHYDETMKVTYPVYKSESQEINKTFGTLRADGLFNITNAIAGYNPERKFEFYAFMGPALQFAKAEIGGDADMKSLINGSLGLGGKYNINKNWALNLEVRGEVSESPFGDYSSTTANGFIGGSFGATYYFGGKKFVKVVKEASLVAANTDIQKYKELLATEQTSHAAVKEELAKEKAKAPVEVVREVEVMVAGPRAVFFNIGSAVIDAKGMVNINLAADIRKANPDVKYVVNGYADKATGSVKTNQKLSEKRAQAVYNALIKAGVSESQVEWKGLGGQPNMWNNSRVLTRVVVIEKAN